MFDVANDCHITNILERVTYIGKIKYRGEILDGLHEPLVDEGTWNRVQAEIKRRSVKKTVTSSYLLTGLLYCARCGAKMRYQKWGNGTIKIYCYSQQKSRPKLIKDPNCDNEKVNACDLEEIVLKNLFSYTKKIKSTVSENPKPNTSAIEVFKKKYDTLVGKIKRLYNLYAESGDTILLQTIEENKKELQMVENELSIASDVEKGRNEIEQQTKMIANLEESWSLMTIKEKQQALRLCINKVVIDGYNVSIQYNF